jgi:hypothetical protein
MHQPNTFFSVFVSDVLRSVFSFRLLVDAVLREHQCSGLKLAGKTFSKRI